MNDIKPNCTLPGKITILPENKSGRLRLGWIVKEEVGIVINNYTIASINLSPPPASLPPEVYDHIFDDIKNRFELLDFD